VQSAQNGMIPIRGVIFDYGNVLCYDQRPSDVDSMAQVCGIAIPRFQQLYWKFRMAYDRADLTAQTYWHAVAGEEGFALSPDQIARLIWIDTQSWARLNEKTIQWAGQLHHAGLRIGLLSNMPRELSQYLVGKGGWVSYFHHLTFSCDVGMVKPDPLIYKACLQSLAVAPQETLFLDDLPPNIEGAAKLGIRGVLFDTMERTASRLREQFDLPLPDFLSEPEPAYE
jgi:putative hydrolase of the HAD superfamily